MLQNGKAFMHGEFHLEGLIVLVFDWAGGIGCSGNAFVLILI